MRTEPRQWVAFGQLTIDSLIDELRLKAFAVTNQGLHQLIDARFPGLPVTVRTVLLPFGITNGSSKCSMRSGTIIKILSKRGTANLRMAVKVSTIGTSMSPNFDFANSTSKRKHAETMPSLRCATSRGQR